MLEPLVVKLAPSFEKKHYPSYVQDAPDKEYAKDTDMVGCHCNSVDNQCDYSEDDIDKRACQKGLYPVMVTYSLNDIADEIDIEKGYWQLHQLQKEIGNERDADSRCNMKHKPGADTYTEVASFCPTGWFRSGRF